MSTVVRTGKCGLYFRVIEAGEAEAGETMRLVDRSQPDWSIRRLFHLLIGGGAKGDMAAVRALVEMPVLADAWRERARKLAE